MAAAIAWAMAGMTSAGGRSPMVSSTAAIGSKGEKRRTSSANSASLPGTSRYRVARETPARVASSSIDSPASPYWSWPSPDPGPVWAGVAAVKAARTCCLEMANVGMRSH
jgi:hypothetical protein